MLATLSTTSLLATESKLKSTVENNLLKNARFSLIIKKNNKVLLEVGNCDTRRPPFSTFKVALALMGFDSGILQSKDSPVWPCKEEYFSKEQVAKIGPWYTTKFAQKYNWIGDQTPATFMKNSVVWFSHQITQRIGEQKFQDYVNRLDYGNKDVSGVEGKNNGLLVSWLGTSLKISPREQVEFLEKLLTNNLDVSSHAHETTREIMNRDEDWNGWKLFGKTGGGSGPTGWFIGWIEKDGQQIIFAHYIQLPKALPGQSIGLLAKDIAKEYIMPQIS